MKPQVAIDTVLGYASALLRRPLSDGQAAAAGADHLVVFATTPTRERVVIKVGEDAHADAYVLEQLRDRPVKAPRLLAQGVLRVGGSNYPLTVMTCVEGEALAVLAGEQHRYLPAIVMQMDHAHQVVTTHGAGPVLQVVREATAPTSWKAYLLGILRGEDPEFDWGRLYASPLVDGRVLRRAIAFLIERVAALPEPAPYRLLHGDLNPHNILVDRGELTGIIDWSYARYGDRLFDFARLRMNPFVRQERTATAYYFALLDLTPEERAREQVYYLFNLVEYVNWYALSRYPEKVREHIALLRELLRTA